MKETLSGIDVTVPAILDPVELDSFRQDWVTPRQVLCRWSQFNRCVNGLSHQSVYQIFTVHSSASGDSLCDRTLLAVNIRIRLGQFFPELAAYIREERT